MKKVFLFSAIAASAMVLTVSSCKKEEPDTETQSAIDNNICETEFTKMHSHANGFAINEQGVKGLTSTCVVITSPDTIANPGWPRTMTIDYGTTGCTDSIDGKTRKGKIMLTLSNRWHLVGSEMKITLVGYSVNGVNIMADSIKIIHSGANAFTNKVFKGKCQNSEWSLEWECDRTFTQTGGTGDLNPFNDVYELTGTASGKNREGKSYAVTITSPIVKRSICRWIEKGRLDLTPEGLATRTIDFGSGTCDNQANLIINGNTFSFTMN